MRTAGRWWRRFDHAPDRRTLSANGALFTALDGIAHDGNQAALSS